MRLYVENAIHTVTDSKNWVSQEKRNRGIATATHDVFVVHEVREVYHSEYDQGRAVWSWLQDQEVKSCIPEMKNIPDCHIHNQSYGNWYDAPRPSGGCVTGDTKICLSDGREIPISQIREGMEVLSENGTVSVTSDEKVINRHITCLYGINDIPPFMSLEHAVLTEEGWKSLDPETTNSINSFYHAAKLQVGDVVYTLKGKEIVRKITKQYADIQSRETFTGYDLHFRQGYQSYYANGILVLLNYPEITIARIKRVLDSMSFQKQKRFRHMIEQNYDISATCLENYLCHSYKMEGFEMKIKKVLMGVALAAMCLMSAQAQRRNEIQVPNLNGYTTLKCDFHMHSVFSDGLVWPTVRVDEAYREGLDAISLTEHIEYRPHKKDIIADHNRSYELSQKQAKKLGILLIRGSEITRSMPPGHFNAIFLNDSNPLEQKAYKDAFNEAKKQGAFIFWNHPGWARQQPDSTLWWPEHTQLYNDGCMHGIEVANGGLFMPEAIQWCLDKNLTMIGTSDIHQPIQTDYDFSKGEHRTMTFVFAKERSPEGIREALDNRRTAVYYRELVIGREEILRPFFEKCVDIKEVKRTEKEVTFSVMNATDLVLKLKKTAHNPSLVYFREMTLKPHTQHTISVKFENGIKGGDCNFEVTNFIVAPDKGLDYTIKL